MKGKNITILTIVLLVAISTVGAFGFLGIDIGDITGAIIGISEGGPPPALADFSESFTGTVVNPMFSLDNSTNGIVTFQDDVLYFNGTSDGPGAWAQFLTNGEQNYTRIFSSNITINFTGSSISNSIDFYMKTNNQSGANTGCKLQMLNNGAVDMCLIISNGSQYCQVGVPSYGNLSFKWDTSTNDASCLYAGGTLKAAVDPSPTTGSMILEMIASDAGDVVNMTTIDDWIYVSTDPPPTPVALVGFNETFDGTVVGSAFIREDSGNGLTTFQDDLLYFNGTATDNGAWAMFSTFDFQDYTASFMSNISINFTVSEITGAADFSMKTNNQSGANTGCRLQAPPGGNYDLCAMNSNSSSNCLGGVSGVGNLSFRYDLPSNDVICSINEFTISTTDLNPVTSGSIILETVTGNTEVINMTTVDDWYYYILADPEPPVVSLAGFNDTFTGTEMNARYAPAGGVGGLTLTQDDKLNFSGTASQDGAFIVLQTTSNLDFTQSFNTSINVNFANPGNVNSTIAFELSGNNAGATGCKIRYLNTGEYQLCAYKRDNSKKCNFVSSGEGILNFVWSNTSANVFCYFDGISSNITELDPATAGLTLQATADDAHPINMLADNFSFNYLGTPYAVAETLFEANDCGLSYQTEATCTADASCNWWSNDWGSWCENKHCWDLTVESECTSSESTIGAVCEWDSASGSSSGWCEQSACQSFDGTDESTCETNTAGLTCSWTNGCSGWNSECSSIGVENTCTSTTGCAWGSCESQGCWDNFAENDCTAATGETGGSCLWNSDYNYCYETSCWDYSGTNESNCETNGIGLNCTWVNNYYTQDSCESFSCYHFDFTDQTTCETNTYGLDCSWDGTSYCSSQGCWSNADSTTCGAADGCSWSSSSSGGGSCEELSCWTYDSWNGGTQEQCESSGNNLNCQWVSDGGAGGWCENSLSSSCGDFTDQKNCMDTYYCFWEYTDWDDTSLGGSCQDPVGWTSGSNIHQEWNPSCYIFDTNQTNCDLINGCEYVNDLCRPVSGHANEPAITSNGLNCTMVNSSQLCNSVVVLSSCCSWSGGACTTDYLTTACVDNMQDIPENVVSCEDVSMVTTDAQSAQTLCNQIGGDPWYLPCTWNSSINTCHFKSSDVFGTGTQSITSITSEKNCEAAGGLWIQDTYCDQDDSADWIAVPIGRCEQKSSDDETNCDKTCYACETKFDGTNHSSLAIAKSYCEDSALGYCEFSTNTSAANEYGYCSAKEVFKKGTAGDCKSDCGSCTYLGNAQASSEYDGTTKSYEACNTPECYCEQAYEYTNVKCKWVDDTSAAENGYCVDSSEKTCADACDRCYEQTDCANTGRSSFNATGSCSWDGEGSDGTCSQVGQAVEVCWDAIDNDDDDLIDCADPSCYSDSSCGFTSGDCFGWQTEGECDTNSCTWVSDAWGSWCDFPGADCWKLDGNQTGCDGRTDCDWSNGMGTGFCEQDWSVGETCYNLGESACLTDADCGWTNDTWCAADGSSTDWCTDYGGWCDPTAFANSPDCWLYDTDSSVCASTDGCNWESSNWGGNCMVDWTAECWQYEDSSSCGTNDCVWQTDTWGSWCTSEFDACWSYSDSASCDSSSSCDWNSGWNSCEPSCYNMDNTEESCNGISGCFWSDGWCMEDWSSGGVDCWNSTLSVDETLCNAETECTWQGAGWCNPTGFAGGDAAGGYGGGANTGMECWKYDGDETNCLNSTATGITCSWLSESWAFCEPDWSVGCWENNNASTCGINPGCTWDTEGNFCKNQFDVCWNSSNMIEGNCNNEASCAWSDYGWGGFCEPSCFGSADEASCGSGCKWIDGWCNAPGTGEMFDGMDSGAPVIIAMDFCDGVEASAYADLCGIGMKDMDDAYGFGSNVFSLSDAAICNQEKIGINNGFGNGQENLSFYVYLDSDGSETGGCSATDDSTAVGYEFYFKYDTYWDSTQEKAIEEKTSSKCSSSGWEIADVQIDSMKSKMCGEIGGPLIAVDKNDLAKFPTLYDETQDLRVYVTTADSTGSAVSPSDIAGPGYVTPGAIDFQIQSSSDYGVGAGFEEMMQYGYVKYEDCYDEVDNDADYAVDCDDWDCEFATQCVGIGVNAPTYIDTTMPLVTGVKIEGYPDSALVMYDTSKPTNGTLQFWYNDSSCSSSTYMRNIHDVGITNANVREMKMWHEAEIYNDTGIVSLNYTLDEDTDYYYKLKVCDSGSKCAISACSKVRTTSTTSCPYCDFVTRIKTPDTWTVSYDLNQDGDFEHVQGKICGESAGMKTNYSDGRDVDIKLNSSDGGEMVFTSVRLSRLGLTTHTRDIETAGSLIVDESLTDASGDTVGLVGMLSATRDKIVNNLHPEVCQIVIPSDGTCTELWHCDDVGGNCVDMESEATLITTGATSCTWQLPYCEFSTWATGQPATTLESSSSSSSSGSSGGSGGSAEGSRDDVVEEEEEVIVEEEESGLIESILESILGSDDSEEEIAYAAESEESGIPLGLFVISGIVGLALIIGISLFLYLRK
ncbi:hypothetical protein HOG31_03415 [archaeon]|jgi:hypothetical protein|nr:hypothetical protein [archaeon]MBT3731027.1 hypothetical protein [archaeon]MBT4669735.1 hypothetical protein [archaeon]MBT7052872.1 hypothetical protein [archaeon]